MSSLAEFEWDLLRERVRSGLAAAARAKGRVLGRQKGFRPKSDKLAPKVLKLIGAGHSFRDISRQLKIDKNTVLGIVQRARDTVRS
jgi:putative DNA-invertase from lambdoid prophage Rac